MGRVSDSYDDWLRENIRKSFIEEGKGWVGNKFVKFNKNEIKMDENRVGKMVNYENIFFKYKNDEDLSLKENEYRRKEYRYRNMINKLSEKIYELEYYKNQLYKEVDKVMYSIQRNDYK